LITISPALAAPTVTSNAATMAARDFIFGHLSGLVEQPQGPCATITTATIRVWKS
jgi:hypothetical protein